MEAVTTEFSGQTQIPHRPQLERKLITFSRIYKCLGGGTEYTLVLEASASNGLRVQISPEAPNVKGYIMSLMQEWLDANNAAVEEASKYLTKKGIFNPPLEKP